MEIECGKVVEKYEQQKKKKTKEIKRKRGKIDYRGS